jgi:hypothetical protein
LQRGWLGRSHHVDDEVVWGTAEDYTLFPIEGAD